MARHGRLAELIKRKSLRHGTFVLASGRTSNYYIDGKLTSMDPEGATAIAEAILKEIEGLPVDAVGGMDMGATPIVGAFAAASYRAGRPLPTFVVRKEVKAHGTMKEIEGPIPAAPSKVVLIDDVVTSGGSILKAINAVRNAGHEVLLAIAILDRNAGAAEAMERQGIRYQPLVTLEDIGIVNEPNRPGSKIGVVLPQES
jgi:orotate phosphoribosyltransferase